MSFKRYNSSLATMPDGTNGDPLGVDHTTWVAVTSPIPPGRIASVGPARPDEQNTRLCATTGVGIASSVFPRTHHNTRPSAGSYPYTRSSLLTISSSRAPAWTTIGVPHPTVSRRGVRQITLPVALSNAATKDALPPSW